MASETTAMLSWHLQLFCDLITKNWIAKKEKNRFWNGPKSLKESNPGEESRPIIKGQRRSKPFHDAYPWLIKDIHNSTMDIHELMMNSH